MHLMFCFYSIYERIKQNMYSVISLDNTTDSYIFREIIDCNYEEKDPGIQSLHNLMRTNSLIIGFSRRGQSMRFYSLRLCIVYNLWSS